LSIDQSFQVAPKFATSRQFVSFTASIYTRKVRRALPRQDNQVRGRQVEHAAAAAGTGGEQKLQNNRTVPEAAWNK
jgi:hypothetical protein